MAQLESHPRSRQQKRLERSRWRVDVFTGFLPVRVQQEPSDGFMMPTWLKSPGGLENVKSGLSKSGKIRSVDGITLCRGKLGPQSGYGISAQEVFSNGAIVVGDDVGL